MNIKFNEKELKLLDEINYFFTLNDANNLAFASPIHVVFIKIQRPLNEEKVSSNGIIIKYKIDEIEYESIDEIKEILKQNVFDNLLKKEKFLPFKDVFHLDFFMTDNNGNQGFKEVKKELFQSLKEVDDFVISFDSLINFIIKYKENNEDNLEDFPFDVSKYITVFYELIDIPNAIFSKKIDAKKFIKQLDKKGIECYFESYSTKDKKNDISILKNILNKLIKAKEEV